VLNSAKNNALEKELFETSAPSASSSTGGKRDDKQDQYDRALDKLIKEIINKIVNIEGNDKCCDCNAYQPDWLVTNLGILVCIECCGIHREMGVQISKTQSIKIDRLSSSQLIVAHISGNRLFNKIFEANLDSSQRLQPNSST
jgi:Arf-GAP/SH3 domain/ANK repeat/PH domain-containing protein